MRGRRKIRVKSDRAAVDPELARERTMKRAVKLLSAKPRSVAELRGRLLEKPWTSESIVDAVIDRLKEYGYLDDKQFAVDLALSRLRRRPQGMRKLRQALKQKLLTSENVDHAVNMAYASMPESDLIDQTIERRIREKGRPTSRVELKKLNDHLLRRGFSFDLIAEKLEMFRFGR